MPIENVNKEGVNHLYLMLEMEDAADRGQGNTVATRTLNKMKIEMVESVGNFLRSCIVKDCVLTH